jgi:hypothetical protein
MSVTIDDPQSGFGDSVDVSGSVESYGEGLEGVNAQDTGRLQTMSRPLRTENS